MEVKAKAKFIKISAKKTRLVADLIRGLDVDDALVKLQFTVKAAVAPMTKVLKSAVANGVDGTEGIELKQDNLFVKKVIVDEGPTLKRWQPRAFGRAGAIRKRSCHISIVLSEKVPTTKKIKKQVKKTDDIVKISDLEQVKSGADTSKGTPDRKVADQKRGAQKGFVSKVFNRKAGDK
jgi:large subunit ribosomal protein L22